MKDGDLPIKNGVFPMRNGDLPMKDGDFPQLCQFTRGYSSPESQMPQASSPGVPWRGRLGSGYF